MAVTKQARLSFELAEYAADVLETLGIEALAQIEEKKHSRARVARAVMVDFLDQFRRAKAEESSEPISLMARQIQFGFASSVHQLTDDASDLF